MALHRYIVDVEYNSDPKSHPITVTVNHFKEEPAFYEVSGKNLRRLLGAASKAIAEQEEAE